MEQLYIKRDGKYIPLEWQDKSALFYQRELKSGNIRHNLRYCIKDLNKNINLTNLLKLVDNYDDLATYICNIQDKRTNEFIKIQSVTSNGQPVEIYNISSYELSRAILGFLYDKLQDEVSIAEYL